MAVSLCALLPAGCGQVGENPDQGQGRPGTMSDADYVAHAAALTIAVEEGLTGEAAELRVSELGGGGYSREDVEAFSSDLRSRPDEWLELEKAVDARVAEIRESAGQTTDDRTDDG